MDLYRTKVRKKITIIKNAVYQPYFFLKKVKSFRVKKIKQKGYLSSFQLNNLRKLLHPKKLIKKKSRAQKLKLSNKTYKLKLMLKNKQQAYKNFKLMNAQLVAKNIQVERFKKEILKKDEVIKKLRLLNENYKICGANYLYSTLNYTARCLKVSNILKADAYLAYCMQAMVATEEINKIFPGKKICNVIEIPSLAHRSLKLNWMPEFTQLIDNAFETYLFNFDKILTVGHALALHLEKYNIPVQVIENYRYAEPYQSSNFLREECRLLPQDKLIVAINIMVKGSLEPVIECMRYLDPNIHLAIICKFSPPEYELEIQNKIKSLNLENRIHLFGFFPYAQLTTVLSAADIGLIILNPKILNHQVALPNRLFDLISAGLPVCSLDIKDISKIIKENNCGHIISENDPWVWAEGIKYALSKRDIFKQNTLAAREKLTWESKEAQLLDFFGDIKTITLLGNNDILNNNRSMRIAKTLAQNGIEVKIAVKEEFKNKNLNLHKNITCYYV
ncbi:glycosyltransferase [Legionella sp. D16C41]|uniref:glycosyltransferase n=1 Tax=Legionella sp. D16C41 TaxID=3402688 RepID=UPI003AF5655D